MITTDDLNAITKLINNRRDQVLEANNITSDSDSVQYQWIAGIYDDISSFLNTQFE